jgi:hypothetical protein
VSDLPRIHRIACAALVAALHAGALMQLGSAVPAPSQAIVEEPMPKNRALLVWDVIKTMQSR